MSADNPAESPVRNFLRAVGRGFVRLGDAIRRASQIQRLRSGIRRRQRDRRRLLIMIGEKVYGLHTIDRVRNAAITGDCDQIDALMAEIEQLKTRIIVLKTPEKLPELIIEPEDTAFLTDEGAPQAEHCSEGDSDEIAPDDIPPEPEMSEHAGNTGTAITTPAAALPQAGDKYDDDLDLDDDLSIEIDLA